MRQHFKANSLDVPDAKWKENARAISRVYSREQSRDNSRETSREQSRDHSREQSFDSKDEELPLETGDSNRLQIAVGAFQRKYRSMSVYGEHVIDIAERSKKALFIFPERNSVRMFCKRVVENKYPFRFS